MSRWQYATCTRSGLLDDMLALNYTRVWMAFGGQRMIEQAAASHNCTVPKTGVFEVALDARVDRTRPRRHCPLPLAGGRGGRWVSPTEWRPAGCVEVPVWRNSQEILQCLAGKTVIFSGDSVTRQLFGRLVSWIRDQPLAFDHYYHTGAAYTFDEDGDHLTILSTSNKKDADTLRRAYRETRQTPTTATLLYQFTEAVGRRENNLLNLGSFGRVAGVVEGHLENFAVDPLDGRGKVDTLSLDDMNDCGGAEHYYRR
jgi:hypothetical protein